MSNKKQNNTNLLRCAWVSEDELYIDYHDKEWGVASYDDAHLFEMLILEGAQAGLSWITVLKKRENYRQAFDNFDYHKIANYRADKINALMENAGIIRNKLKIHSAIKNAKGFIAVQQEFGSFSKYIWAYVDNKPIINHLANHSEVPASTALSEAISKDLKKRGFNFVGPTIMYAYMQSIGMVMDHTKDCFVYDKYK